ncbi:alpha/beta-Hydrolase [Glarea lozoyensis ATCC 20868]|uniref:Alpha/beta-Hydrolase n=1 Tax=Glarea lozoyensis (strain ATCC 20868 / MF5171) TaxID=1116229 RepID=S3DMI8_GLAL2|nr:alpha/beta-Hydrolase [Glarea lozoyensis ATCC 20868]EPE33276.1 alpha/beta-Hydrolase [Glarea lozoyensis ATCC 20868]
MSNNIVVLPRPSETPSTTPPSIKAPPEATFIEAFGNLLPPLYLQTPIGRAAYYELLPSVDSRQDSISRVLLVHGIQTCAIGLQRLASELSLRFPHAHIVWFDLWGHGLTDTPYVAHEPKLFHSLLNSLMAHLEWENAHVVGYSFGGSTTVTFANAYPERVISMVLIAPAGLMRTAQFNELEKSYLGGGPEEQAQAWILQWLEGGQLIVPANWKERVGRGELVSEAVRDWQNRNHEGHKASVVSMFRDGGCFDTHDEFAEVAKRGLNIKCILGQLDDVCSEQDLCDVGIRNVSVIPETGHGVVRENVPEVADLIEVFWRKIL